MCTCMHAQLLVVSDSLWLPWTVAHQAALSLGFSRQESWSGLPFPPPGDFPHPGIEPASPCLLHWQVDSLPLSRLGGPLGVWASVMAVCRLQLRCTGFCCSAACGIFPSRGSNPCPLHRQVDSYRPSSQGSPRNIMNFYYSRLASFSLLNLHVSTSLFVDY